MRGRAMTCAARKRVLEVVAEPHLTHSQDGARELDQTRGSETHENPQKTVQGTMRRRGGVLLRGEVMKRPRLISLLLGRFNLLDQVRDGLKEV